MKTRRQAITFLLLLLSSIGSFAQSYDRVTELKKTAHGWDNKNFGVCWYNEKDIFNIGSYTFCSPGQVLDVRMSPAGTTFAALYVKGKSREVSVYSYVDGKVKHTFRLTDTPTALAYTANARQLCIGDAGRNIRIYNTSDYSLFRTLPVAVAPKKIALSYNGYFIAISDEHILYVLNMETGKVRKVLEMESSVNHIAFSPDNAKMAVLTENGLLYMYETKTFAETDLYENMRDARECLFHPEGKYIAIITSTDQIAILNMKNPAADRQYIDASGVGICHLGYARTVKSQVYLVYNAGANIIFHPMEDLVPDYERLIALQVEEKMDEWLKQMPGESLSEYQLRVNEETRAQQYAMYENEVATRMAGELVEQADVSFGSYNQEESVLEVNFDNMPPIFLEVPQEDVAEFSQPEKLTFENSVYTVNEEDKFELIYTEVTNTETGKKYVFDNLAKQQLEYLTSSDDFVPLDLIQQSSMEEVMLQEIREEIVTAAKEASLISEHTHIDVKTKVEASTNADGEKIMNYSIEFNYDVEQEFSAKEDFGAGKYIISQSESALAMLRIVQNAFANEFKQYIRPGKKVILILTGSADAAPVTRKIPYGEEYGWYIDEPVHAKGELTSVTVSALTGITTNEQLAFLRAMGVKNYVEKNITDLNSMQKEYDCYINVSNSRGAEFRRIGIKFVFVDAFDK